MGQLRLIRRLYIIVKYWKHGWLQLQIVRSKNLQYIFFFLASYIMKLDYIGEGKIFTLVTPTTVGKPRYGWVDKFVMFNLVTAVLGSTLVRLMEFVGSWRNHVS